MEELLIYTQKNTPRLNYIFKHVFVRILNIPIKFTAKIEDFVAYDGLKMSYGKKPLGDEFFVQSHGLLLEQGIDHIEISVSRWESLPCFFTVGRKSAIPFDIFSASFYLLSRYEEYLPTVLDENECFSVKESIAYKSNFLDKPLIDVWACKMLKILNSYHPDFVHKPNKYNYLSTFNVTQTFLYKYKGAIRGVLGLVSDLFTLKIQSFLIRSLVVLGLKKDPYDNFQDIIALQKRYNIKTLFFFLVSNYTTYDNNISYTKKKYHLLIKSVADYCKVGLLASYFTKGNEELLKKENNRLANIVNTPTLISRQHYVRNTLPDTYQSIIDAEITEDYSMYYYNHVGFRASTCTPFYFYDLDFEIQTPLKVYPVAFSDKQLRFDLQLSPKQALFKINHIYNLVKQVNGTLVSVFHNDCLSNFGDWKYWDSFYEDVLNCVTDED